MYTTYTAHITIPNVYADDAPDALNDVAAYRNPFPTTNRPSLLSGRRHHAHSPTATYDATITPRQIESDIGSTSVGLRATAHTVKAVATTPAAPTASATATLISLRRLASTPDTDAVAITPNRQTSDIRDTKVLHPHAVGAR